MIYNYIPIQIGGYYKVTGPEISYQYDELQFLVLTGVQLPAAFQVDFCNEGDTSTITMVGTNSTVQIPDEYLLTGKRIKAYIVLTGSDEGAVETRIEITLPVNRRPSRTDIEPTPAEQSTIDSLVAAMNEAVEDAETAQGAAEDARDAAQAAAQLLENPSAQAETLAAGSPATAGYSDGVFNFGIPEGEQGAPGEDGVSPVATVAQEGNVITITITDADGTTSAEIDLEDVADLVRGMYVENVSGTDPIVTAAENTRYICGTVDSLSFTPSPTGICDIVFTTGASFTASDLTLPVTLKMPSWFAVQQSMTYEINVAEGVYGSVMSWT